MNTPSKSPGSPALIMLVDDDRNILTSISMALKTHGYGVVCYTDGEKAYEAVSEKTKERVPDLAVLDIKMPRMDGMELLRNLRLLLPDLPVIFLTSKDEEIDEIVGLKLGADDYITKPFSQRLLLARIETLLRRRFRGADRAASYLQHENGRAAGIENADKGGDTSAGQAGDEADDVTSHILVRGALTLDEERHLCTWKGRAVPLTVTEYLLIKTLALRPGHVKSRDQLIDQAYGEHIYIDDRTIDSHIKRLRKKFKKEDPDFEQIETLYGLGYKFKD